jgi:hypothetical protein
LIGNHDPVGHRFHHLGDQLREYDRYPPTRAS